MQPSEPKPRLTSTGPKSDDTVQVRRAARAIARVLALQHDALQTELASVLEHERAVRLFHVLVEPQPRLDRRRRGRRLEGSGQRLFPPDESKLPM